MKEITYTFTHKNDSTHYTVVLEEGSDTPTPVPNTPAEWAELEFHKCEGCTVSKKKYCPVALSLQDPIEKLAHLQTYDTVDVTVDTPERSYQKTTSVQDALGGLFGLIMARSGCPSFTLFRGLAWQHLPFPTVDETLARVAGRYLIKKQAEDQTSHSAEKMVTDLAQAYDNIHEVNCRMVLRLTEGGVKELNTSSNAIVLLDSIGSLVHSSMEDGLKHLRKLFK